MSNKRLWITAAVVLAAAAVYFLAGPDRKAVQEQTLPPVDETPVEKILRETIVVITETEEKPSLLQSIIHIVDTPDPPESPPVMALTGDVVRLNSNMTIASVNGVAITMKDLMPVNPGKYTENNMGREMFNALLNRAINRELAYQEARRKGVSLTDEQKANLEKIRQRALERDPASFTDVHDEFEAKAEFEVRDFAGLMLQESLLAASGGPPKYVSQQMVDQYLADHKTELEAIGSDEVARQNLEIDIRSKLAETVGDEYQQQLQQLIEDMKQQASIREYISMEKN